MAQHVTSVIQEYLAHYMVAAKCKGQQVPIFTQFLAIAASVDWSSPVQAEFGAT